MYLILKKIAKIIIPKPIWDHLHWLVSLAGAIRYKFPSTSLTVIGVTGTNGKSTVVELLHDVLKTFDFNVASSSSLRFRIKNNSQENALKMTMPGRWELQKFLREAVDQGCQYVILEVTSEGLKQHRASFIGFDAALITNLRPEHLESHGSFEKYRAAKGKLFKKLKFKKGKIPKISVFNLDDPSAFYYAHFKADKKIGYGLLKENNRSNISHCFIPEDIKFSGEGIDFVLEGQRYRSFLMGDFNLYNVLAVVALCRTLEIPAHIIQAALQNFKGVAGRLEIIQKEPFRVVVDYAHTPDALECVYRLARSFWVENGRKLVCVLGSAGGGRDKWKRPEMGRLADKFCDEIILTDEDPYNEDPENIVKDISQGIEKKYKKIMDRRLAIREALSLAKKGDVVVLTGKGAEKMIMTSYGPQEWDEAKVAREELKKLKISDGEN